MLVVVLAAVAVFGLGAFASSPARTCSGDADCVEGASCVPHYNFSKANPGQCRPTHYCASVSDNQCTCLRDGFECRKKNCTESSFECVVVDNQETRCGGDKATSCLENQICAYRRTTLFCYNCPCYGTHYAICLDEDPKKGTCPDSIVIAAENGTYSCNGCSSATDVLTDA
ncbi:uncharacterized protein LOC135398242 [Ornithodoros turicata]|uniref:uncharacterized protein LOC135398242 n=1 Tax=Ornithodoros turicata TaxID=34597 RepID=UPI003139B9B4